MGGRYGLDKPASSPSGVDFPDGWISPGTISPSGFPRRGYSSRDFPDGGMRGANPTGHPMWWRVVGAIDGAGYRGSRNRFPRCSARLMRFVDMIVSAHRVP
jgi:hypothetical protein